MVSPLQQRRERLAKFVMPAATEMPTNSQDIDKVSHVRPTAPSDWDLVRCSIESDKRTLKNIKPIGGKQDYKARTLPQYHAYLERSDLPADIAMMLMVWLFDCGDLRRAMPIALKGALDGAVMPTGFKCDVPTFIADAIFAWSEAQFRLGHSPEPYFSDTLDRLINDWNLFEIIAAKYYKLAGLMALGKYKTNIKHVSEPDALSKARDLFEKAEQQYLKIGVGTRIEQITLRLDKLTGQTPADINQTNDS